MISVRVASDSTNQPVRNSTGAGVEHAQHQPEGEEVEQRADRAEGHHEPTDEGDVPM